MNVETEIKELKRRVDELESEVDGEKLLTRHIYEAVKRTETKVDRLEDRMDRLDGRMGGVEGRMNKIEGRMDKIETQIALLRDEMPDIVSTALREVLNNK